jgi:diguanylate cyclase (GGDEF)-like protein
MFGKDKDRDRYKRDQELDALREKNRQLRTLIEINTYITNSLEKDDVLGRILNQIKVLLNCESSSILLVDDDLKQLNFAFLSKDEDEESLKNTTLKMGEGIAGTVWQNGMPMLINDAQNDPRFCERADRATRHQTNSIIAVPLTVNGEIIGVIEAINKVSGGFSDFDLQMLQFCSNQSAIAINNADLYNMAIKDSMTRLYIKKYFRERFEEEWNRSIRMHHPLSLVIFDIDHFKSINDTYGHQAGDRVIKEIAGVINRNCRSIDIPCRYGGEEFTVILPETVREDATVFIERIRKLVESLRIEYEGSTISVTISCGFATLPDLSPGDYNEMVEMADAALYYSKKNGRNKVSFFDPASMSRE